MPTIDQHQSAETTKLLFLGDSGTGKTGALASLAAEGYNLRIIDVDNGIDILKGYLTDSRSEYVKKNPKCRENLRFETLTERMKLVNGQMYPTTARVWPSMVELLSNWIDSADGTVLGPITTWTPKDVLVIDSLSMLSSAAMNFHLGINGQLGKDRTQNEWRRDIGQAQEKLRTLLATLYDKNVKCNVIVTAHIKFTDAVGHSVAEAKESGGQVKGYPSSIGAALAPQIPRYFNSMLVANVVGSGSATKHRIYTRSQVINSYTVAAKTSAPLSVKDEYPLEWGLAEYFKAVRQPTQGTST